MPIAKSSRHQKIIGDFGESLICNWLSRSGFEVTIVDHTGIDIVAYNLKRDWRIGISVKSRTRNVGQEGGVVKLIDNNNDILKIQEACKSFACEPWIGIYVETDEYSDLYLLSLKHLQENYSEKRNKGINWKMSEHHRSIYLEDKDVYHLNFTFRKTHWFNKRYF